MIDNRMPPVPNVNDERLESWKEIAAYLKKGVRTVQRWDQTEGLPIRRMGQDRSGFVIRLQKRARSMVARAEPPSGRSARIGDTG
jgi:hypothetical protein